MSENQGGPSGDKRYSKNKELNTLDPGPHFVGAQQDPGATIQYGPDPGDTFIYTDSTAVESPDDPVC